MPHAYTYELELEASEYPEIFSNDMTLVIKYFYYGGLPSWFNPLEGIGQPEEYPSVEIQSIKIRPSANPKSHLLDFEKTYSELAETLLRSDDLYDRIIESHEHDPGGI